MNRTMTLIALLLLAACGPAADMHQATDEHGHAAEAEPETGPHGGRLLEDGDFALELAIFETGVPPEYRAWATSDGMSVSPGDVDLDVTLTRSNCSVSICVADDGVGFEPTHRDGHGLANLAERVAALDGHLAVDSGPGRGTIVRATLPIPEAG